MSAPVSHRELKPKRKWGKHLLSCLFDGHEPGEWMPRTTLFGDQVIGRIRYCMVCGVKTDFDLFGSDCGGGCRVFKGKVWYPDQLLCRPSNETKIECGMCGEKSPPNSVHAEMKIHQYDFTPGHLPERKMTEHFVEICPGCWPELAEELGVKQ